MPAAKPRRDSISSGTLFTPLGASLARRLNTTASAISAHNPIIASVNSVIIPLVRKRASISEVKAKIAQVMSEIKVVKGSLALSLEI